MNSFEGLGCPERKNGKEEMRLMVLMFLQFKHERTGVHLKVLDDQKATSRKHEIHLKIQLFKQSKNTKRQVLERILWTYMAGWLLGTDPQKAKRQEGNSSKGFESPESNKGNKGN